MENKIRRTRGDIYSVEMRYEYEKFGGLIFTEKKDQFTAIGTNVNLASRLEGLASDDQIIVSPSTKMLIEDEFNLKVVPIEKAIKGFEKISECYEVTYRKG